MQISLQNNLLFTESSERFYYFYLFLLTSEVRHFLFDELICIEWRNALRILPKGLEMEVVRCRRIVICKLLKKLFVNKFFYLSSNCYVVSINPPLSLLIKLVLILIKNETFYLDCWCLDKFLLQVLTIVFVLSADIYTSFNSFKMVSTN